MGTKLTFHNAEATIHANTAYRIKGPGGLQGIMFIGVEPHRTIVWEDGAISGYGPSWRPTQSHLTVIGEVAIDEIIAVGSGTIIGARVEKLEEYVQIAKDNAGIAARLADSNAELCRTLKEQREKTGDLDRRLADIEAKTAA